MAAFRMSLCRSDALLGVDIDEEIGNLHRVAAWADGLVMERRALVRRAQAARRRAEERRAREERERALIRGADRQAARAAESVRRELEKRVREEIEAKIAEDGRRMGLEALDVLESHGQCEVRLYESRYPYFMEVLEERADVEYMRSVPAGSDCLLTLRLRPMSKGPA